MAAGLAQAGFRHAALVEYLPHACETLRAAIVPHYVSEPLTVEDVLRDFFRAKG